RAISGLGILESWSDDDGEKYGGKTLERLLEHERVEGSICVARWYGGVLLGPVRFRHLEEVGRGAIRVWRESVGDDKTKMVNGEGTELKRRRVHGAEEVRGDDAETKKMVDILHERDESIHVLRQLLEEKTRATTTTDQHKDGTTRTTANDEGISAVRSAAPSKVEKAAAQSPAKPGYDSMKLEVLKRLEKARDKTISVLLLRIEEAERKGASSQEGVG
ncbi:MAG: hypothetical protein Q9162_006885, partial [Coniocarpon cinnabarinum]